MERICTRCGYEKPLAQFISRKNRPEGKGYHCLSCESLRVGSRRNSAQGQIKVKEHYQRNKGKLLAQTMRRREVAVGLLRVLKNQPCVDCGGKFPTEAMDFDHLGGKTGCLSNLKTCSLRRILDEVAKCELVCSNCHRLRTRSRLPLTTSASKTKFNEVLERLKDGPCVDCGGHFPAVVMDFDHRGNKLYTIARMWSKPLDLLLAEVSKCDLRCSNCHRVKTRVGREVAA